MAKSYSNGGNVFLPTILWYTPTTPTTMTTTTLNSFIVLINPAHPQNCHCYNGIYEFIDSCYCQNYYRASFSHPPELFVTCDQNFQFLPLTHSFSSLTSACTIPYQLSHTIHPSIHTVCELTPSINPLNV
jgi:hypothetical protein